MMNQGGPMDPMDMDTDTPGAPDTDAIITEQIAPTNVMLGDVLVDEEGDPMIVMETLAPGDSEDGLWHFLGDDPNGDEDIAVADGGMVTRVPDDQVDSLMQMSQHPAQSRLAVKLSRTGGDGRGRSR